MEGDHIKIKSETGIIGGSLGALVSMYGDGDDSDQEDGEDNKPTELLPNPLFGNVIIKEVPVDKTGENAAAAPQTSDGNNDGVVAMNVVSDVITEVDSVPSSSSSLNKDPVNETSMDFASIRSANHTNPEECRLNVQDFLGDADSYSEARPIKVEVESGTSDSELDSDSPANESDYEEDVAGGDKDGDGKKKPDVPRAKGELDLRDLPPIEDLHISVPHDDCKPIGVIKSVVETLVIVEAYLNTPALDLESVLFLEKGDRALGHIFDVIGPVKQPLYCVRFNSREHIQKNKVEIGMPVYCAPKTKYTSFVFLAQLRKLKGSDASWVNDIEPPADEVEFSDDEMERIAKKKKRNRRNMRARATEADAMYKDDEGTGENHSRGTKRHVNHNGQQTAGNGYGAHPPLFAPPLVPGFIPYGNPGFHKAGPAFPPGNMMHNYGGNQHRFRGHRPFRGRHPAAAVHHHPEHWEPNNVHPPVAVHHPEHWEPHNVHPPVAVHHPEHWEPNVHPPASPYAAAPHPSHFRPWCPPNPWRNNHQPMTFDFRSQNPFPNTYGPLPPPPPPPRYPPPPVTMMHTNYEPPPPGTNASM